MDKHSPLQRTVSLCALLLCTCLGTARGSAQYSYGRTPAAAIGLDIFKTTTVSEIFVATSGRLLDVDLALNISHPSVSDLGIYLISPAGTIACLNLYDVYDFVAFQQDYNWTIFNDSSRLSISEAAAPFVGAFRPKITPLSVFNDENPYGVWTVKIVDAVYGDTGTLTGVRLDLLINPEPSTAVLLISSLLFALAVNQPKNNPDRNSAYNIAQRNRQKIAHKS